ncbi:MAG: serine hydrolase domain-containing protein, partial [Pseudomonadales bacterium]
LPIFAPLGMTAATLLPVAGLPGGYQADGRTEIPYWHMTYPAFGALNASAADMSRFLTALVIGGRVPDAAGLPGDLIERFFRPDGTLGTGAGLEVGYGAGIYGRVRDGHVILGHGGDADGYRARYGVLPEHGRGYALVINTDNPRLLGRMVRQVESALLADLPAHPAPVGPAEDLTRYAGTYYPSSSRFGRRPGSASPTERAEITVAGNGLRFRRSSRTTTLLPAGGGRFYRPGDPAVTAVFVPQGPNLYLQGELGNFVNLGTGPCPDFLGACE